MLCIVFFQYPVVWKRCNIAAIVTRFSVPFQCFYRLFIGLPLCFIFAVLIFDFHKAFQSGFIKVNSCPDGFLNIYIFNAVDLLNLFHKMFVKLRYFLVRLFSLLKLNILVFKVIVHIFFNKVFGGHTFYDSVCT